MAKGTIYITGLIGSFEDTKGTELTDIMRQVSILKDVDSLDVIIENSEGGCVDTGYSIANYLKSLNIPITTIAKGYVASISTIIFLSGGKRLMSKGAELMIHTPWADGVTGDSDKFLEVSKDIKETENKILKDYVNATNQKGDALLTLMKNETWIDSSLAFDLGFATHELQETTVKAVAYINNKNENKMSKENDLLSKIKALFDSKPQVLAMDVNTVDGDVLVFEKESGEPEIGDKATVNGETANGNYSVKEGAETYTFENGNLTEIIVAEAETETTEDVAALISESEAKQSKMLESVTEMVKKLEQSFAKLQIENKEMKTQNEEKEQMFASLKSLVSEQITETKIVAKSATETKKEEEKNPLKF